MYNYSVISRRMTAPVRMSWTVDPPYFIIIQVWESGRPMHSAGLSMPCIVFNIRPKRCHGDKPLVKITEQHNDAALRSTQYSWPVRDGLVTSSHRSINIVNGQWVWPQSYKIWCFITRFILLPSWYRDISLHGTEEPHCNHSRSLQPAGGSTPNITGAAVHSLGKLNPYYTMPKHCSPCCSSHFTPMCYRPTSARGPRCSWL